ncbi:oxidoreductase [Rhabdobacter roseus]|uniref:Photosystem II stability/assembly factor-like uncharacterized protein n=1 Tax=Rhabdobacter roseus TaxID=1655419 RepID=A0A840TL82_9BACT|nr:YCF48-related protein [Rhabdobacter roseus]MBB5284956.1 photosystem II stability/assembly factor-like uncharacterized protein [Rhabdobacter roseus]
MPSLTLRLLPIVLLFSAPLAAQWHLLDVKTTASFRTVHALSSTTCWIGGTKGTIVHTTDGGQSWNVMQVPGADSLDFRCVRAFDQRTALAMSAGLAEEGKARIYRTQDGGTSWQLVYQTTQKGVFLDGMDFWDAGRGIGFGDPIDGRFFILTTQDGGRTWQEVPLAQRPEALPGEAAFAASGTSLVVVGKKQVLIGTGGGKVARVLRSEDSGQSWQAVETPLAAGPTSGIFGLRFWDEKHGLAVGGDYRNYLDATPNVLLTQDGGATWQRGGDARPNGLKEAVGLYRVNKKEKRLHPAAVRQWLLVIGASGSGYSPNYGQTWVVLDQHPFHAVSVAGNVGYAVGGQGLVGKFEGFFTPPPKE